ncbi:hypothetical protein ACE7GA_12370 [Roseomonas sp. CCTCC AB2023176]|uniref:hypothetical protein n=1 Tax=Roseomonas sp. CCTCC AB2023176 TaxID=3342640 RepID=UPI0035E37F7E
MREFRGPGVGLVALSLSMLLPVVAAAQSQQCRMECDAGAATNLAEARLCLARCEVRVAALGSRGPSGTTAMPNPQTAWTTGPQAAPRAAAPPARAVAATAGRPARRGATSPLPQTLTTAMANANPANPSGGNFMARVMGAQAATLPASPAPARPVAGRRTQ